MKPIEEFPAIKNAVNDGIVTGLHRLHTENPDPTYLEAQEYVIGIIKSYLDVLTVRTPHVNKKAKGKRKWVGLTEDEALDLLPVGDWEFESTLVFAKAIEDRLKEKNYHGLL